MNINDTFKSLHYGLPDDIARLRDAGFLDEAVRLIDRRLSENKLPSPLRDSLTAHREILIRTPDDYPYTREDCLSIIREHIPEFTDDEFQELVDSGKAGWIFLNGEKRYFNRFFSSVCKTDPAFSMRAGVTLPGVESATEESQANSILNASMRSMKQNGSTGHTIRIKASVQLKDELFVPGAKIKAWLPVPCECENQSDITILSVDPPTGVVAPADAPQRTVCWEEDMAENHPFTVEYSYRSTAYYRDTDTMTDPDIEQPDFDTSEIYPHVVFTPYIRALAETLSQGKKGPIEKARAFYDFITQNMFYSFMPQYFCMENIAESCARNMTGDCGVFALLFMTLCRVSGIPAKWQSGLVAEPDFIGGHDWIRFYAAPYGWIYADPSFGIAAVRVKNEERRRFYFGNIDPFRMIANSEFQADFTVPETGFRTDPYDNQLGEMQLDGRGLTYDEYIRYKNVEGFDE